MTKKITLLLISFIAFFSNLSLAQDNAIEQTFHESGKINVVVSVVTIIFIGIIFYLIKLERKISKLEKNSDK
jgi:CcmD family protein